MREHLCMPSSVALPGYRECLTLIVGCKPVLEHAHEGIVFWCIALAVRVSFTLVLFIVSHKYSQSLLIDSCGHASAAYLV